MSLASELREKANQHREVAARAAAIGMTEDASKHYLWADYLDEQAESLEANEK